MNKVELTDERIVMEKRKINSAASAILSLGVVGDIIYKVLTKQPYQSYTFEIIIVLIAGLFILFEGTRKGVINTANNKKEEKQLKFKYLFTNTLLALTFGGADLLTGQAKSVTDKTYLAIGVVVFIFIGYLIDLFLMKKANRDK
ncbi:MAG: DUF6773 family protein [Sporolactobacillus sp.]